MIAATAGKQPVTVAVYRVAVLHCSSGILCLPSPKRIYSMNFYRHNCQLQKLSGYNSQRF